MIDGLSSPEVAWLSAFFAAPNGLTWDALATGAAPPAIAASVRPWIEHLASYDRHAPIILPFVRGGEVTGWYATTHGPQGGFELGAELIAWLGPAFLRVFETVPIRSEDAMAVAMRCRFGGTVYRFTGPNPQINIEIAARIADYRALLTLRPPLQRRSVRTVGRIRADFERALLAQDETQAEAMIVELRDTGRLNEENLRYLDVRLRAGLGHWPQIARDHWLVATMSDLALPPQILADIIEALYRTYIDELEPGGNLPRLLAAFDQHIAKCYPRLFASRRGIRTPRVVKAFLLHERLQNRPNRQILDDLAALLPDRERQAPFVAVMLASAEVAPAPALSESDAEEAFDDAQFDRAIEFYLSLPLTRKSVSRMLSCALFIGTDEVRQRFLSALDKSEAALTDSLAPAVQQKLFELRSMPPKLPAARAAELGENEWMRWADQLARGDNLPGAEAAVRDAAANWDVVPCCASEAKSKAFADIIGNLSGGAAAIVQRATPQIFAAFFPQEGEATPATKPIAAVLFVLIALNEALAGPDLDLLAQLLSRLLELGLSGEDYESLIGDLEDIQRRVGSYAHLPWSLDVCEILAVAASPSDRAREARLRFFLQILGQAQGFAHRLGSQDLLPIEYLARDYGVEQQALLALKRGQKDNVTELPDLAGQTIGIYTLAEAAGVRAKLALEAMFPACRVVINSDLVCTAQLSSLAKAADMFVFAWKSSSHQAFYCVKDALAKGKPIWALGKGTASILRAVLDNLG